MRADMDCTTFDEHVDELALGMVEEPLRSRLLAHASACPTCRTLLDELGSVADGLLLAAPEAEPPAGFESRALARIAPQHTVRRRGRWLAVAAAVVLAVAGLATVLALTGSEPAPPTAAIVNGDRATVGQVQLVDEPRPHVLVTIDHPQAAPGTRHCELQLADGSWVEVGTWDLADVAAGVWAVGIDRSQLDAIAMRVTTDDGTVLATATF